MVYDKAALLNHINRIRNEIGHEKVNIDIKDILYERDSNEMWIITNDRPDKSAIIGKGGWVVGRLREELEIESIHVESYSDFLQKKYRMELSLNKLNSFVNDNFDAGDNGSDKNKLDYGSFIALNNLIDILKIKLDNLYSFNFYNYFKELHNIDKLVGDLDVPHEYIQVDYTELIEESFTGRFHPCGRCSKVIEETVCSYAIQNDIPIVIFGDMLATGSQCITEQFCNFDENDENELSDVDKEIDKTKIIRLNLPASLSVSKLENKSLTSHYNLSKFKGFGCPLLYEVHKKFPHMKKYSIQRILRETRSGVLEPGEALDLIWSFYNTD